MAYSEVSDLLLGTLKLTNVDPQKYVDSAMDEIHAALGNVYVVPFNFVALDPVDQAALKLMNNLIATGRLYQALANNDDTRSYGENILREGQALLYAYMNGMRVLASATTITGTTDTFAPILCVPGDEVSAVESFYGSLTRGQPWGWQPGPAF